MKQKESRATEAVDWCSLDDDILIKAHLKGDPKAFEVLFKKYREQVARLVYSIVKHEALVQDIVQEVFLLVFRHLSKFRQHAAFKTWIYRITVNESLRQLERARRWQPLPDGDAERSKIPSTLIVFENGESPERVLIDGEQKALVHDALNSIRPHHRTILVLYYLEDLSVQEIAEVLEIPEGSVKSRLFYARDGLRKVLDPVLDRKPAADAKGVHAL
ncbi:MAG: sigma-70 family RNA polymerase sigma factor [SAR324 cluster bacterium]|nr:sigma-70 family RNA polymerase sigma factor [SAR324 cluster bacterium]